ncbi:MAG TPA: zinc-ribbon domain containing protein [Isosphaeraceae bacterium]|jgi:hypothetical protein|nr:zinc-ribbon domain containing protein [Isosphaeraceae bacterium]
MKSNKQRRAELKARKAARRAEAERAVKLDALAHGVAVDRTALAPDPSDSVPAFVERGYYVDRPFECRECGVPQTWTAAQQKWWYEVAKGNVWTTARLCRPCRRRERARREEARRVSQEGLDRQRREDA